MLETKEVRLPFFRGFYNTTEEEYLDNEEDQTIEDYFEQGYISDNTIEALKEKYIIDYKKIFENFGENYVYSFEEYADKLKMEENIGIKINKFIKVESPRYYNYRNDWIIVEVEYDNKKLQNYIIDNIDKIVKHINDNNYEKLTPNEIETYKSDDLNSYQVYEIMDFYMCNKLEDIGKSKEDIQNDLIIQTFSDGSVYTIEEK